VAHGDPCPPTADPNIPRFLSDTIDCLLEKSPNKRFQSAAELAELLRRYLAVLNQTPTDKLGEVLRQQLSPVAGRRRRLAPVVAIGLLCGLVAIGGSAAWHFGLLPGRLPGGNAAQTSSELAVMLAPIGAKDSNKLEEAEEVPATRTVSVAQTGGADYTTLNAALGEIGPGSIVRILDSGEYRESLVINDARKWQDITIEGVATPPPTIVNPDKSGDAVTIRNTPGVVLRGVDVRQVVERQFAVRIIGPAAGVTLDRVRVQGDSSKYALIYIVGAWGEPDRPIVIRDSQIDSGYMGIVVQAEGSTSPVRHVHVISNRFHGRTRHTQFNIAVQDIQVLGNVFDEGVGVELSLPDASNTRDLVIANNTFFRNRRWLDLKSSSPELAGVVIANNLILQTAEDTIPIDPTSNNPLMKFIEMWSWPGNHWEIDSSSFDPLLRGLAEIHGRIATDSRDPQHPKFLRLATPLPAARPESGLPPYVGALAP
jgi:eukaryotic-like serine/threonine-protein kinase